KAPVESLMPLRLARYGVPLAETAPSGLAAAGIEPALLPPASVQVATPAPAPAAPAAPEHRELESSPAAAQQPQPEEEAVEEDAGRFAEAYQRWIAQATSEPTASQFAAFLRSEYGITTAAGGPLSDEQLQPLLRVLQQRYAAPAGPVIAPDDREGVPEEEPSWEEFFYSAWLAYAGEHDQYPDAAALAAYVFQRDGITGATGHPLMGEDLEDFVAAFQEREFGDAEPPVEEAAVGFGEQLPPVPSPSESDAQAEPVGAGAHAAEEKRGPKVNAAIDGMADEQTASQPPAEGSGLTTVDRYYVAWAEYQQQHGAEPNGVDLSKYLGESGVVGRNGRAAAASTLRRYLLPFRIYSVWAEHRVRSEQPSLKAVAEACAARGITLQYNEPITAATIAEHTADFERRWHAVIRHRTDAAAQSR
ncbi:hypothetical protein ACFW9Q_52005, partial [Streptomyces mirabilis]